MAFLFKNKLGFFTLNPNFQKNKWYYIYMGAIKLLK